MSAQTLVILLALLCYLVGFLSKRVDNIYYYCGAGAGLVAAALLMQFWR